MTTQSGFVADFTSVVVDQTLAARTKSWAKLRYQNGFTLTFDDRLWSPLRTWEAEGAMSCGIKFLDENGQPIVGLPMHIGWGTVDIPTKTNSDGWVDVPISNGNYPGGSQGPMWIRTEDGTLQYSGIGWRDATNHGHLNLDVRRSLAGTTHPPIDPPIDPPSPPDGGDEVDVALIEAQLKEIERAVAAIRRAIA
jgi:hypothetical protein